MGDAKRRGPREKRVAEGIEKRKAEEAAYQKHLDKLEATMTPEERARRRRAANLLLTAGALGATAFSQRGRK